jgi:adenylate kinase family enzyme
MQFAILGNSGSGKSTLARKLSKLIEGPVLDLDSVVFEAGKIAELRDQEIAARDVVQFCSSKATWVVEGCYSNLIAATLSFKPHLIYLDLLAEDCVRNCLLRPFEAHKFKDKAEQDSHLAFLLTWVRDYENRSGPMGRAEHMALFSGYLGPKTRLRKRGEVGSFSPMLLGNPPSEGSPDSGN